MIDAYGSRSRETLSFITSRTFEILPSILKDGGLHSDAVIAERDPRLIGYSEIKKRRLNEIHVPCCGFHYVGDFVPFYFCPRSPMLFTVNKGNTGHPPGCQRSILHLVSTVADGLATGKPWAISSGNAGAYHTTFESRDRSTRRPRLGRHQSDAMAR